MIFSCVFRVDINSIVSDNYSVVEVFLKGNKSELVMDYIILKTFNSKLEAEISKAQLESNGIDAYLTKDDCGEIQPQLQLTQGVQLLVDKTKLQEAIRILKDNERLPEKWKCEKCNEILESQFEFCWNCGTQRGKLDEKH